MKLLCKGGSFTTKLFQGVGVEELIKAVKPYFSTVRRFSPDASRNSSSEVYLVCRNFMPWMLNKNVKIRDTYEELLEPKLSGNEIDDGPDEVFSSFQVRKKKD
jgi:23S rRNA (uridine2552-2'-O)-methyltransferase